MTYTVELRDKSGWTPFYDILDYRISETKIVASSANAAPAKRRRRRKNEPQTEAEKAAAFDLRRERQRLYGERARTRKLVAHVNGAAPT